VTCGLRRSCASRPAVASASCDLIVNLSACMLAYVPLVKICVLNLCREDFCVVKIWCPSMVGVSP
jgi:hypothetical protein